VDRPRVSDQCDGAPRRHKRVIGVGGMVEAQLRCEREREGVGVKLAVQPIWLEVV
jgi:hypothetical protein